MRIGLLALVALGCTPGAVSTPDHGDLLVFERRSATLTWDVDPLAGASSPEDAPVADFVAFQLFDDVDVDVPRLRAERRGDTVGWFGASGDTTVRLAGRHGLVAGTVRTPGHLYQLRPVSVGVSRVVELDEGLLPDADDVVEAADGASGDVGVANGFVDQLVVYTAEAAEAAGGIEAIEAVIALAEAETNDGFAASGVPQRVRVVGTMQVDYDETSMDWSATLGRLRDARDGDMDLVHAMRDQVGADQVTLLVDDATYCGLAYLMSKPTASFASEAFAVVSRVCATGYYSFAHELGHNLGSDHDHAHGNQGARAWSYGFRDPEGAFRTVMAYDCDDGCGRVNRWSNPTQTLGGKALGVAGSSKSAADNTRSITELADVASAWRASRVGLIPASELASPAADSRLGTSATFAWTSHGATDHALDVGSEPGGDDWAHVASLGDGSGTFTVGGLPTDGTRVYARLWSRVDDGWTWQDTSFLAQEPVSELPGPPVLAPTAGAVLAGDVVTFRWANTGATEYHLYVGSERGGYDVASTSTGTATQLRVTGIPTDGRDVWVRVWAYTPDVWMWTDVLFVAATR